MLDLSIHCDEDKGGRKMRLDIHTHGKLSKKSAFLPEMFLSGLAEAKEQGLTAIALTEHFNTSNFYDLYEHLDRLFPYEGDCYTADGLIIFPGLEVDVRPSGHILLIGARETILDLRSQLEPYTTQDRFLTLDQLLEMTEERSLIRIGAHPFRESNPLLPHASHLLQRFDALDLNAKDLYTYGPQMKDRVEQFAAQLGIPVIAGSDTHQEMQYGSVMNHFQAPCVSISELRERIRNREYEIEISSELRTKVKAASMIKKLQKQLWKQE